MKGSAPMLQLRNQGIILGEDSEKMSKSRGNVISPDELVASYGADTVRAYLMFFARWDLGGPWNSKGIEGTARWIRRVWTLVVETTSVEVFEPTASKKELRDLRRKVHRTLRSITNDFEASEFNTIISSVMELLSDMYRAREIGASGSDEWKEAIEFYLLMMAPVTPHVAEELWEIVGKPYSIHTQRWPEFDQEAAEEDLITLVIQINGKVRDRISVPAGIAKVEAESAVLSRPQVEKHIQGKKIRKIIYVPDKLVNIVV